MIPRIKFGEDLSTGVTSKAVGEPRQFELFYPLSLFVRFLIQLKSRIFGPGHTLDGSQDVLWLTKYA